MEAHASLDSIPNEILLTILDFFPTSELLPLTVVSRYFGSIVLRIIRHRLVRGARLPSHRLILECYHPSAKLSTPYLFCDYLFTDGLDDPVGSAGFKSDLTVAGLRGSYSHFRTVAQEENQRARRRYPRQGRMTAQSTAGDTDGGNSAPSNNDLPENPTQDVFLDETESFSQLCTVTNLLAVGPRPGQFLSHVNVGDGLVRVWRAWLAEYAGNRPGGSTPILWADACQNVGVRFRVTRRETDWQQTPVLIATDEGEMPVTYRLEFEELVVRTGRLLLCLEKSEEQGVATSGKAMMIISI